MFDVEVKNSFTIDGMDIMLKNHAVNVTVNIYYKSGTHVGYDKDASVWMLLYTRSNMDWAGNSHTTQPLPEFNETSLSPGTYGFFIDTGEDTSNMYTDNKAEHITGYNQPYAESQDVVVKCGKSKRGWASTYSSTYGFQGAFYFHIDGTRHPTEEPTLSPTTAPSGDCNDNDACTNDLWNFSTETCYYETTNCDDNDSCTTDSCDPGTGCNNTVIPLCCGDGVCDPIESCQTCHMDCCASELLTVPSESGTSYGIGSFVFEINAAAVTDIVVRSFTLEPTNGGAHRALVLNEGYAPCSSHYRYSSDASKWTEIGSGILTSGYTPHQLDLASPVMIPAGQTRCFALEAVGSSYLGKKHSGMEWEPFVSNANAGLSHSMAVPSLFGGGTP